MVFLALLFTCALVYAQLSGIAIALKLVFLLLGVIFSILSFALKTAFRMLGFVCLVLLVIIAVPLVLAII